jgi:ATP-dependent RNA helicase DeaD
VNSQHDAELDPDSGSADLDPAGDPGFADLDLPVELLQQLDELGYEEPTSIQREAVPPLVSGRDVLGQAATGTGKTAAFALPLLARLHHERRTGRAPFGLVVVPTRELAMQVSRAIHTYGTGVGARVLPVYGGQPIGRQIKRLSAGVDVVVATPGRAVDHLGRGTLDLSAVAVVVLDEADEMLDMGFAEDLDTILDAVPPHQTALFSATMPGRLVALAQQHMVDPVRVSIDRAVATAGDVPRIREQVVVTGRHHTAAARARVLDVEDPTATLVFCRTRTDVEEVARSLAGTGRDVRFLHGGLDQGVRSRVLADLRDGTVELVVATDVAARGLDVDVLSHVVNHSLPTQPEQYVHRIGRVGRAGREGVAITLVEPRQSKALRALERHLGRSLDVTPVPTVEQLRARRTEQLVARVRDRMQREDLTDGLRAFDALGDVEDAHAIAVAALAVLHEDAAGVHDTTEVPQLELSGGGDGGRGRGKRDRDRPRGASGGGQSSGGTPGPGGDTARVWLSVGRNVGIRPKDVVGAVCGETSLSGRDIGEITIMGRFTLVEVPATALDEVVTSMRQATVRGKRVHAKPDRAG